jgi:hypothetical protein
MLGERRRKKKKKRRGMGSTSWVKPRQGYRYTASYTEIYRWENVFV